MTIERKQSIQLITKKVGIVELNIFSTKAIVTSNNDEDRVITNLRTPCHILFRDSEDFSIGSVKIINCFAYINR